MRSAASAGTRNQWWADSSGLQWSPVVDTRTQAQSEQREDTGPRPQHHQQAPAWAEVSRSYQSTPSNLALALALALGWLVSRPAAGHCWRGPGLLPGGRKHFLVSAQHCR